jgi:hypothetical protein
MAMTLTQGPARRILTDAEADAALVEIEKGQQLAGHFPDADALGRARAVLTGKMTPEQAHAEIAAKYRVG